jgi:hypothetical protein
MTTNESSNLLQSNGVTKKSILRTNLPLTRPHERILFLFYLVAGLASTKAVDQFHTESILVLVWLSFILAISFMEAWVKFKAPLLRKYVAVDVGRYVFASLNAVELGLAGAFWITRALRGSSESPSPIFPAVATGVLLFMVLYLGPMLFLRAKYKMVHEAEPPARLMDDEIVALQLIADEIREQRLPHANLHIVYVCSEVVKVLCLILFLCGLYKGEKARRTIQASNGQKNLLSSSGITATPSGKIGAR